MKYGLIPILVLTLLSCSEDLTNVVNGSDIKGKWVDVETRMDTLSFELRNNFEIMYLRRGKEIREGYLLPKYGSGPYEYKLSERKISLNWMLSSNYGFKDYYFKVITDKLSIGNFYDSKFGETLIFEKLD